MALNASLLAYTRALGETVRSTFAPAPAETNALGSFYGASAEAQEMFSLIEARIDEARTLAAERGDRPTLEDYRQACIAFGETEQGQALATPDAEHPSGRWNARVYSNLGSQGTSGAGHNLSSFALSEPQKRAMTDVYDQDGDHAITDFYTNIDFTGANLNNAYVDPATSFNEEIARAKNLEGLTFNNMREGDRFEFGAGNYTNVNMTNINGGEIVFGDGSRVDGLTVDGLSASITMGDNARVNNVTVNDTFRIVNLAMGEGAVLSNSNLTNATISMASEFEQGATLQNVQLGSNVAGLDFSGLRLNNVTIGGKLIQNPSDLTEFDIAYDNTTFTNASPEMAQQFRQSQLLAQVAELGKTAFGLETGSNNASAPAPVQTAQASTTIVATLAETNENDTLDGLARAQGIKQANEQRNGSDPMAAAIAAMVAAGVSQGAEATASGAGIAVAVLKRTVDPEAQASGANMQRSGGSATA